MTTDTLPTAPITSADTFRTFALAGNAHFTIRSKKTGTRFTYKIRQKGEAPHFVSLLTGSDNTGDYTYLGSVFDKLTYRHGVKSRITPEAPSAKAFAWLWSKLQAGEIPAGVEVWHEGRCGRCNRLLTDPESITRGLGPECAKHT